MNKISEWYKNYVIFIGIFTLLAMGVLFINLLGWFTGTAVTVGFSSIIGGLVWFVLMHSSTQPLPVKDIKVDQEVIRIVLKDSVERLEIPWKKIIFFHSFFVLFLNVNFFWMAPDIFLKVLVPINMFYLFIAFLASWVKSRPIRKARSLIGLRERIFSINEQGLYLPIEILNESAIYKAIQRNEIDIFVPWQDILECDVFNQIGRAKPQIRLRLKRINPYVDLMGYLSIFRIPQLDQHLDLIQNYLHKKLKGER